MKSHTILLSGHMTIGQALKAQGVDPVNFMEIEKKAVDVSKYRELAESLMETTSLVQTGPQQFRIVRAIWE